MLALARTLRRTKVRCALAAGIACMTASAHSADREAHIAAAYVFNFIKFVDWLPFASIGPIDVCFRGSPDVREAFAAATSDKTVGTRAIVVRALEENDLVSGCDVLYVDARSKLVALPPGSGVLTIGEASDFTGQGGSIRLFTESNRLRFVINTANAERAGLQLSSNLLKLASRIEREQAP